MNSALFLNFTKEEFVGYWNGKPHTFKAGESKYMPQYLAEHFAKHLTNKVLIEQGKETATSPKNPEQVPQFMELFNKACIVNEEADQDEAGMEIDIAQREHGNGPVSSNITIKKNKEIKKEKKADDDDENFEGLKTKK